MIAYAHVRPDSLQRLKEVPICVTHTRAHKHAYTQPKKHTHNFTCAHTHAYTHTSAHANTNMRPKLRKSGRPLPMTSNSEKDIIIQSYTQTYTKVPVKLSRWPCRDDEQQHMHTHKAAARIKEIAVQTDKNARAHAHTQVHRKYER